VLQCVADLTGFTTFDFPVISVSAPILLAFASSLPIVSLAAFAALLLWSYRAIRKRQLELIDAVNQLGAEVLDALEACRGGLALGGAGQDPRQRLRQIGSPILTLENIELFFGGLAALRGVSLEVREHEILGIVGPNGAGKTSILNVINGECHPQQGTITFKGRRRRAMDPREAAEEGIARTFHNSAPFMKMTVLDIIMLGRELKSKTNFLQRALRLESAKRENAENRRKVEQVIEFLGIQDILDERVGQLPYERQRRVELARALVAEPELLLLDETMAGLSADEREDMRRLILDLNDQRGTTIVLVQHYMGGVREILDRVVVLERGGIIAQGTPDEIWGNQAVVRAYLSDSPRAG
jgi:branched-chain amino acid transport system ATP-binding protein